MTPQETLLASMSDPLYLPTLAELKIAFPLSESYPTDSVEFPWITPSYGKFQTELHNFQVYTQEFIASLAIYLAERIKVTYDTTSQTVLLLEVGAGDGRLTHFLKPKLAELIAADQLVCRAVDTKEWEENKQTNVSSEVEKLDYLTALTLAAGQPTIVISCWMTCFGEWTADFRRAPQVFEYLLIGDAFRTAGFGADWYLPADSGFTCHKLTTPDHSTGETVITGSRGLYDGSPHNTHSRTIVQAYTRN